ncbi:MAG TPA: hypothetical protein VMJ92_03975 [Candidatus Limnocylindrales bacterium]|nr:hypothetical protein [Candidatus Limnocylindrales bacterium]
MSARRAICGGCGGPRLAVSGGWVARCVQCGAPRRLARIEVAGMRIDPGRLIKEGHPAATLVLQRILARALALPG